MHCFHLDQKNENNYGVHVHHPLGKPRTPSTYTHVEVQDLQDDVFCLKFEEWDHTTKEPDWKRVCVYLSVNEMQKLRDMMYNAMP